MFAICKFQHSISLFHHWHFFFNPLVDLFFKNLSLGLELGVSLKNVEGIAGPRLSVFNRGRYPDDITVSAPLFVEEGTKLFQGEKERQRQRDTDFLFRKGP